jgi:hypothetical protein
MAVTDSLNKTKTSVEGASSTGLPARKENDMKIWTTCALVAAVLAVACGAALVQADTPAKAKPDGGKQAATALTHESLMTMLKNMGYEPQIIDAQGGGKIYRLKIKTGGWTYDLDVALSGSKRYLWVTGWLATLPKDEKVPAENLLKLLESSLDNGPYHFRYHKEYRQLSLGLALLNSNISATSLREGLDDMCTTIKNTEPVWNVKKWKGQEGVKPIK